MALMSERQFIKTIGDLLARHRRRIDRLKAVQRGDVKLKRVEVRAYSVRAYKVSAHVRYL